jgi:uncharacterized protein YraI
VRIISPSIQIRQGAGTRYKVVGSLPKGTVVNIRCKVNSTVVGGNTRWYRLSDGRGWISARWAKNVGRIEPYC